ncbi:FUSC family protein, partial [Kitasatospora sp. NPDC048540]
MNTAPDRDAPPGRTPVRRRLRAAAAELRHGTAPLPAAARRAVRVTAAACAGFYGCLYGLDLPVAATYALFAAVALAGLSRIPGTGRQRAAVIWRILPASWLLISLGTLLAVRTWAAVLGMLVIGFVLAFAAAAGPRPAGAAPGLQLLYILPCFPPYEPHTLGDRLGGATLGLLLLIAAEALLLPDPTGPGYPALIADAADLARRCTGELTAALCTLSADTREAAASAGQALRPSRTPEAERPASPGVRARALADAGCAARVLLARLLEMPPLTPPGDPGRPDATADADADSDTGSGAGAGTTADAGAELLAAVGAATDRAGSEVH